MRLNDNRYNEYKEWHCVFGISQEMHLMHMHGMEFSRFVENAPVLLGPDPHARHRSGFRRIFLVLI
jgi:hypothetical protein